MTCARAVAVFTLHAGFVLWLTWPLAAHLATHLPDTGIGCRFDGLQIAWVLAYLSHRLVTAPSALAEANIYHPTPHALFTGEAGFGALPYFTPVFLATGNPALAYNLTFLLGVSLTAWALHVVVHRWTGLHAAGALAAWTFLMTRWVLWTWVPSVPTYALMLYAPFILLLAATPERRGRDGLLLLLLVLQGLATAHLAMAVFVPLGVIGVALLGRRQTRRDGLRLLAVAALAAVVLAGPYAGYARMRAENPELASQTVWRFEEATVRDLPWDLLSRTVPTAVPLAALTLIAVGALLRAFRRDPTASAASGWRHSAAWTLIGTLISLGLSRLPDGTVLPAPHTIAAAWLPAFGMLRRVDRLGVAALIGAAVLAGLAFAECARRLGPRLRLVAVLALGGAMYAEYSRGTGLPEWIQGQRLPRAYPLAAAIGGRSPVIDALREPGGPLVEVPVPPPVPSSVYMWPVSNLVAHARAMYRSIFHWRPLLNGYRSFWPRGFLERMALVQRLPDPVALEMLRRETALAAVLVHTDQLSPPQRAAWLDPAVRGLRMVTRDGADVLFEVLPPVPQPPAR